MFQLNLYAFLDRDADLMADALSGGVCMKKVNGLTNRTAAMLMSGMLYFNDSHNYQRNSKNREPPTHC